MASLWASEDKLAAPSTGAGKRGLLAAMQHLHWGWRRRSANSVFLAALLAPAGKGSNSSPPPFVLYCAAIQAHPRLCCTVQEESQGYKFLNQLREAGDAFDHITSTK